jgi:hypothetical protein
MRALFGVVGLLIVLAIVGMLAKKQMSSVNEIKVPTIAGAASAPAQPGATVQQQSQNIQQQYKEAAEAAVQQPRTVPDEK